MDDYDDVIKESLVESYEGLDQLDLDLMPWKTHLMIAIALVASFDRFIR